MKASLIIVPLFFLFCSYSSAQDVVKVFQNLNDLNAKWLQAFSIPEIAMMLKSPFYRNVYKGLLNNITGPDHYESQASIKEPNTRSCSDDLVFITEGVIQLQEWALQMLDSDGKLNSGLLRGSLNWPGHFGECNSVYAPKNEEGHGGFHGKYCATTWKMNATKKFSNLPLVIGMCFPDSCSDVQIRNLGRNLLKEFNRVPELQKVSSLVTLTKVECKATQQSLDLPSIIYLVVVSCFLSLSVIGSVLAVIHHRRKRALSSANSVLSPTETSDVNPNVISLTSEASAINSSKKNYHAIAADGSKCEENCSDTLSLTQNSEFSPENLVSLRKKTVDPVWKRFFMCFSAIDNGKKILNTDTSEGQLLSVHGVRFLSLTWVILGHTYITPVNIIGNKLDVLKEMDSLPFQMMLQAPFSVDSFFLLSGFLLTYLFLKEADKKNGKINWLHFYLHRLWRLTPVYMVVVFFYIYIFKYLGSGPFWDDNHGDTARSSWWKYLLYINNFIPIREMCVGWSWYLANDMQFYVISPIFLYPLWRWPVIGFSLLGTILIGTYTTTAILNNMYDIKPLFVGVTQTKDLAAYVAKTWDSFDIIYDKPYCRIAPYIIGVILGFMLYKINQRKNFLTWWQQIIGWAIAAFCSLSVVFGLYHSEIDTDGAMFYNTLCRSAFVVGLGWLIFACETGHGGFLATFLSWKPFIPLSRLTYCAYLVHPILIHGYYLSYQTELFFTQLGMVTIGMGFILISFGLAFLFSIAFESPLMNLEKLLLKSKRH